MNQSTAFLLHNWQNFYVILGSAAGALTGLQFVVITLIAQTRTKSNMRDLRAFGTPTVVHFCTALLVSALVAVPWPSLEDFGACLGACGGVGLLYSLSIFWHARKALYNPDLEERIWYTALPFLAHLALVTASVMIWWNDRWSLNIVAVTAATFLILGIHNSWDTVTYVALKHAEKANEVTKNDQPQ